MFDWLIEVIKKNQPVSYTGMFAHTYYWVMSSTKDYVYKNSNLKPTLPSTESVGIYCIHGTADQPLAFSRIAERLLQHGLPQNISSIHLVAFKNRYQGISIKDFAQQLLDKIKIGNHKRVILMGHSRGGLVSTFFAENLAKENGITVEMVLSLGTPFCGSYLALKPLSLCSNSVAEMALDSDFLKEVTEQVLKSTTKYYFFVAGDDYIVSNGCAHIPSYTNTKKDSLINLTSHGHLSMMSSQKLVTYTQTILNRNLDKNVYQKSTTVVNTIATTTIYEDYNNEKTIPNTILETTIYEDYDEATTSCNIKTG